MFACLAGPFFNDLSRPSAQIQYVTERHPRWGIIGTSTAVERLRQRIEQVASSAAPCLVTGETGSGKDLVARAIHSASGRGRFQPINCGALVEGLAYSELFGYRKGAFTGAGTARRGLVDAARFGTIFLDEIGDMPVGLQPHLLRVLDQGEIRPLGSIGAEARSVEARFLAATNRDLEQRVRSGRFREDLLYRLKAHVIEVPPLRTRPDDITPLSDHFLNGRGVLTDRARRMMKRYPWPGNVRELRFAMEDALARSEDGVIHPEHLPLSIPSEAASRDPANGGRPGKPQSDHLEWVICQHSIRVLQSESGRISRSADRLGINRKTLSRRLMRWSACGWIRRDDPGPGDRSDWYLAVDAE